MGGAPNITLRRPFIRSCRKGTNLPCEGDGLRPHERRYFRNFRNMAVCFKHVINHSLIGPELPKFGRISFGRL